MKVLITFADGFEEIEAITCVDVLRRAGIDVITASLKEKTVRGAHNLEIISDSFLADVKIDELDGIVLPGGMPGSINLRDSRDIIEIVKELYRRNKLIAAICAAPLVLERAGVITNKNITCYPGIEVDLKSASYTGDRVVVDGNIITGKGPGAAHEFAIKIVEYLVGEDKAGKLKKSMIADF
ncbi:MAG: DJ-1/PfpI family protein [Halanaerobiaceae bacterium]|nr:DJ-1/PfpI family protein [Halanaerobiaceae bacterium]